MAALGRGVPGLWGGRAGTYRVGDPRALELDLGEAAFFLVGSAVGVAPGVLAVCPSVPWSSAPGCGCCTWCVGLPVVCLGRYAAQRVGGPWFRLVLLRQPLLLVCWRYV